MTQSPLQFAKDFARLQGQLAASPPGDSQLLLVLDFWQEMREHRGDAAYRSYFDEYQPLLMQLVEPANLADLSIVELTRVRSILAETQDAPSLAVTSEISLKLNLVTVALAKMYFYVGAVEEGLAVLPSPLAPLPEGEGNDEVKSLVGQAFLRPDSVKSQAPRGLDLQSKQMAIDRQERIPDGAVHNEFAALQTICARATETNHPLAETLNGILIDWQGEREAVFHDRARCLFVERDDTGRFVRGRLRTLVGKVDLFGKSARTDEITFDNAIKTPDDPFVGVAYSALAAVRNVFRTGGLKSQGSSYYHAHFAIADSGQTFTGDSIGLAFGLLAYVQLLRPEVLRLDRLLSGEVAFTGGVDTDGRLTAVNDETLGEKIERAFFSPIKYVVLPEANTTAAKQHLDRLRKSYPRRNLHLIAAERLTDIIEDHNIVRSEKVCIGEFVAKKAAKYGRMTKVQVPLLLVLAYLLLCLIYPKAWVGFDWNPAYASFNLRSNSLDVHNRDSLVVWDYQFNGKLDGDNPVLHTVADIDHDGHAEILFIPPISQNPDEMAVLFCCSSSGQLLFKRSCVMSDPRVRDTAGVRYDPEYVSVARQGKESIIVTGVARSVPAKSHIRMWNSAGDSVGGYTNDGGSRLCWTEDIDSNGTTELFFLNYFDPVPCVSLLVLPARGSRGCSPPYPDISIPVKQDVKGNQLAIMLFPVTDMARFDIPSGYSQPSVIGMKHNTTQYLDAYIRESTGPDACVIYSVDRNLRVVDVRFTDEFISRRNQLVSDGRLAAINWAIYADSLLGEVIYWTDSGWMPVSHQPER
jgi:hypothetical protein